MNDEDDKLTIEALSNANSDLAEEVSALRGELRRKSDDMDDMFEGIDERENENQALKLALNEARKRIQMQDAALTAVGLVLKGFLSATGEESQG